MNSIWITTKASTTVSNHWNYVYRYVYSMVFFVTNVMNIRNIFLKRSFNICKMNPAPFQILYRPNRGANFCVISAFLFEWQTISLDWSNLYLFFFSFAVFLFASNRWTNIKHVEHRIAFLHEQISLKFTDWRTNWSINTEGIH